MTDKPDDRLDELVRAAARDYNRPGSAPREEMWARIEQARREARPAPAVPFQGGHRRRWAWTSVAAAAVLMLGVAIGRYSREERAGESSARTAQRAPDSVRTDSSRSSAGTTPSPRSEVATTAGTGDREPRSEPRTGRATVPSAGERASATERANGAAPYRLAVAEHLARTEVLLTSFRSEARGGAVDPQIATWARDLLRTTRLLQHAQASNDPNMQRLLDDLELVLVQITQYGAGDRKSEELELIEQSMDRRGVIGKLRATLPPGANPAGT